MAQNKSTNTDIQEYNKQHKPETGTKIYTGFPSYFFLLIPDITLTITKMTLLEIALK